MYCLTLATRLFLSLVALYSVEKSTVYAPDMVLNFILDTVMSSRFRTYLRTVPVTLPAARKWT